MVLGKVPGRSNEIDGEPLILWQHGRIAQHGLKSIVWLSVFGRGRRDPGRGLSRLSGQDKTVARRRARPRGGGAAGNDGGSRRRSAFVFVDKQESQIAVSPDGAPDIAKLDGELRDILKDLHAQVFPKLRKPLPSKDLPALESYRKELRAVKAKCDGIMLLLLREDQLAEGWLLELERDVLPSATTRPRCALIDATGLYKSETIEGVSIFQYPNPTLREELQKWLR